MYSFDYQRPDSLTEASAAARSGLLLAGGQSLIGALRLRLNAPECLVDLGRVPDLAGIRRDGNALVIGAMTHHAQVAASAEVQAAIPALADLAGQIGDRQVRAMGTLGGSIANNDPAACYPSAVLALGATVRTTHRDIAADDFFTGLYSTALQEGEIVTAVSFPVPLQAAYAKFRQPASRFSLVGVFVARTAAGVRVAVTGAAACVFRHAGLEAALSRDFSPAAVDGVNVDATGLNGDIHATPEYRAQLIKVMTRRAVAAAGA